LVESKTPSLRRGDPDRVAPANPRVVLAFLAGIGDLDDARIYWMHLEVTERQLGADGLGRHGDDLVASVGAARATELEEVGRQDVLHVIPIEPRLSAPLRLFEFPEFVRYGRVLVHRSL
jgi:hypothetical protein